MTQHGPVWSGNVRLIAEAIKEPLHWRKPQRVFVNSMSDLFHEGIPHEFILHVFDTMYEADRHIFQILTKRGDRMQNFMEKLSFNGKHFLSNTSYPCPLPNVWLGVSVENRAHGLPRIDHLRATPAEVRFLSIEPLLEDLGPINLDGIHWVIIGGESGPHAQPCQIDWMRDIVRQCQSARVPVFVKQLGAAASDERNGIAGHSLALDPDVAGLVSQRLRDKKGGDIAEWPYELQVREFPANR